MQLYCDTSNLTFFNSYIPLQSKFCANILAFIKTAGQQNKRVKAWRFFKNSRSIHEYHNNCKLDPIQILKYQAQQPQCTFPELNLREVFHKNMKNVNLFIFWRQQQHTSQSHFFSLFGMFKCQCQLKKDPS